MTKVGIDISMHSFDAAIDVSGKYKRAKFSGDGKGHSEFHKWLKKHNIFEPHLFMEATGRYWESLAGWATRRAVTVCNPRLVRKFAESTGQYNKTDSLDAECLVAFAHTGKPETARAWKPRM